MGNAGFYNEHWSERWYERLKIPVAVILVSVFLWRTWESIFIIVSFSVLCMVKGPQGDAAVTEFLAALWDLIWMFMGALTIAVVLVGGFMLGRAILARLDTEVKRHENHHAKNIDAIIKQAALAGQITAALKGAQTVHSTASQCQTDLDTLQNQIVYLARGVESVRKDLQSDHAKLMAVTEDDDF